MTCSSGYLSGNFSLSCLSAFFRLSHSAIAFHLLLSGSQISDSIATSGQPTKEQFSTIKDSEYQVIVNLALLTSTNALPNEKQIVEALNLQYIHIPVVWESPKIEDVEQFFNVMEANNDKKIFVHCAANMRVSAFMYLYCRLRRHMNDEDAKKALHQIWIPNEVWQKFIVQVIEHYQ